MLRFQNVSGKPDGGRISTACLAVSTLYWNVYGQTSCCSINPR